MNTTDVSVGKRGLNLFVVAPEIFKSTDGNSSLSLYPCFVDQYEAVQQARAQACVAGKSFCVYKLVDTFTAEPRE